jgi:hypothetical protein
MALPEPGKAGAATCGVEPTAVKAAGVVEIVIISRNMDMGGRVR